MMKALTMTCCGSILIKLAGSFLVTLEPSQHVVDLESIDKASGEHSMKGRDYQHAGAAVHLQPLVQFSSTFNKVSHLTKLLE